MFHYVFLDPATIDEASAAGEMGLGRIIELLQGFRRDVILAETDAWRVEEEIGERVRAIPDDFQNERKLLGDQLTWLKRNSPLFLLEGDDGSKSLGEFAIANASAEALNLILSPGPSEVNGSWTKASLGKAHETEINQRRTNLSNGLTFAKDSKTFSQVAEECFSKLVRHAEHVRVFDYALGKYYNNDQPVNLKRLVRFLRDHATGLSEMEIHTLSDGRISLERDVADLQNEVDFKIRLLFKDRESDLPHPRYFGADGRYLDIDRGIDLCDAHDRCRLTQIKYAGSPV